jgi:Xaa-Pro aminopeptidase
MVWDPQELPSAALAERLARLREALARERLDAFLCYTNITRPSAVTWLTGFTPYWSDGLLLVAREGAPLFATALSKRVNGWIRSTNPVSEVVNTPKPGTAIGERLTADGTVKRLGVLELDWLPAGLADEIAAAAPALEWADATALFAALRRRVDAAERNLLTRADAIAGAALVQVDGARERNAGAVAALVEQHARCAGAEEIYVAIAPDLDRDQRMRRPSTEVRLGERFAVRASVAYKGAWVRRTRTFAQDEAGRAAAKRGEAWLEDLVGSLTPQRSLGGTIADAVASTPGFVLKGWMAESCRGSDPLAVVASSGETRATVAGGTGPDATDRESYLVLSLTLSIDGMPWLGAAPGVVRA